MKTTKKQIKANGVFTNKKGYFTVRNHTTRGTSSQNTFYAHLVKLQYENITHEYYSFVDLTKREVENFHTDFINIIWDQLKNQYS